MVNQVSFDGRRYPATAWLGCRVQVIVDRPLGHPHPRLGFLYTLNYGHLVDAFSDDGSELDAYVVGIDYPIGRITGWCIGLIHRRNDREDKLVVSAVRRAYSAAEIAAAVDHHERFFDYRVLVVTFRDTDCIYG